MANRPDCTLRQRQRNHQSQQYRSNSSHQHGFDGPLPALFKAGCRFTDHSNPARRAADALKGKHDLAPLKGSRLEKTTVCTASLQQMPVGCLLTQKLLTIDRAPKNAPRAIGNGQDDRKIALVIFIK